MTYRLASFGIVAGVLALAGCASAPEPLRGEFTDIEPASADTRDVDEPVRWGGQLLAIHPMRDRTCFEVLSRSLDRGAKPLRQSAPGRRFLACQPEFIDPAAWIRDRLITVTGTLSGFETRPIGEHDYEFPVIELDHFHVWTEYPEYLLYDPYFHQPYHREDLFRFPRSLRPQL